MSSWKSKHNQLLKTIRQLILDAFQNHVSANSWEIQDFGNVFEVRNHELEMLWIFDRDHHGAWHGEIRDYS